jgi:hypothetical protein
MVILWTGLTQSRFESMQYDFGSRGGVGSTMIAQGCDDVLVVQFEPILIIATSNIVVVIDVFFFQCGNN